MTSMTRNSSRGHRIHAFMSVDALSVGYLTTLIRHALLTLYFSSLPKYFIAIGVLGISGLSLANLQRGSTDGFTDACNRWIRNSRRELAGWLLAGILVGGSGRMGCGLWEEEERMRGTEESVMDLYGIEYSRTKSLRNGVYISLPFSSVCLYPGQSYSVLLSSRAHLPTSHSSLHLPPPNISNTYTNPSQQHKHTKQQCPPHPPASPPPSPPP